ncbi:cell wall-binding repeat-containing protein [Clostridium sp. DJ247]|uniref:cell wall-binding repeat-containing protein n=1 Tax=Clostridium sp. DJ247 TaxID=2726188 RepID=UPI001626398C|nr:cell wall-binding repeat-containing protein [Clostridium sp. DJ247]MBC2582024.1 N-acetylmuramoyl-L-alanine amidase [Clostridium sp. DJ247]
MCSRKNLLLFFCAFFCVIFVVNFKVSAAPTIERVGGIDRYDTSVKISQEEWQQSDYVILVSGENFPDALCAAPLAKKYNAPILLTESSNIRDSVLNEIIRLKAKNAFIVGGTGAVSDNIVKLLGDKGVKVTRIQGSNRYDTSIEVAKLIGTNNGVVIASGENFPDALSVASIAGAKQMPIVLTLPDHMPNTVKQYLNSNSINNYFVIGGSGAISDDSLSGLSYKRLSGNDRYETNTAVISEFLGNISLDTTYVANGDGFADALSGSAAAAKTASPIVLVNNSQGSQQRLVKSNIQSISTIKVLGGTSVVYDSVVKRLINGSPIVITIDPGHGGYDSGAVGPTGVLEKNVNLAISLKVGKLLEQSGIDVVYTRTSDNVSWPADVGQDLQARCVISDNAESTYFVSIHANSANAKEANGVETYYYAGSTEGEKLAEAIQDELIKATGSYDRGVKTANFYVIKNTNAPSVLIEVGFISNLKEESLLNDDSFQNITAQAISRGILKTIGQ